MAKRMKRWLRMQGWLVMRMQRWLEVHFWLLCVCGRQSCLMAKQKTSGCGSVYCRGGIYSNDSEFVWDDVAKRLVERAPPVAPPPPRITRWSRAHTAAVADGNPNSGSEYHDEIWGNVWLTSFPAQTHSIYLLILYNSPFTFSYLHQHVFWWLGSPYMQTKLNSNIYC